MKKAGTWLFIYHLTSLNQQGAFFILFNLSVEYLLFCFYSSSSQLLIIHVIEENVNVSQRKTAHLASLLPQQRRVPEMETNHQER